MFRKICINCGLETKNSYPLCSDCFPDVFKSEVVCTICGTPTSILINTCSSCRDSRPNYICNYSFFPYSGLAKEVLTQFKFKKDRSFASYYADLITAYITLHFKDPIICPIPTSFFKRKLKNGYQLDSIVKELKKRGFTVKHLLNKRYSKTQKKLDRVERKLNLEKSFRINKKVTNKIIILLDDVFTTGATIEACTNVLKNTNSLYSITLYRD